jgi:PAS domain S-box-containing protein
LPSIAIRERFGDLLQAAGQMFWEVDRNFRVVFANRLMSEIFGDPVGKVCHEFMGGDANVCTGCPVLSVFEGKERATSERKRTDKHGNTVWLQHTALPIKNHSGEIIGASELIVDITERKIMEEQLRDSEHLYRNLVEEVPDIIISLDASGRFSFVNTKAEQFLKKPVKSILDTYLKDYVVQEDLATVESIIELQPEEIWDEEIGILDSSGDRKFARIRCKASSDAAGRPIGFEGVMRDTTTRRKLEEDLRASKQALVEKIRIIDELYEHIVESGKCKAIQEHTAEVAHELRQPLAIIGGFARRIARRIDGEEAPDIAQHKQYSQIIVSETRRLERILDRLVDFTSRNRVRVEPVNPNELIQYILGIIQTRLTNKRIKVTANLGFETSEVPLDPGRFQQLVLNLLCNAVEASPRFGVIEVETGISLPSDKALETGGLESHGFFEMKIRNEGPVIPPEALLKVFNPFYTTKERGTGLGLTVTKKIVEDHTGSISVKSDEDGTVFTVWFPLTEPADTGPDYEILEATR